MDSRVSDIALVADQDALSPADPAASTFSAADQDALTPADLPAASASSIADHDALSPIDPAASELSSNDNHSPNANVVPPLILASASPRRRELMTRAGFTFQVIPADIDEHFPEDCGLEDAIVSVARQKAEAVQRYLTPGDVRPIIACDTVVVLDGLVMGKPLDEVDARRMLAALSGRSHQVISGVCVLNLSREIAFAETTTVHFRQVTTEEIDAYVASGEPMDKAGAYAIQGGAAGFVEGYEGDYDTIVGLPMARLTEELAKQGVEATTNDPSEPAAR